MSVRLRVAIALVAALLPAAAGAAGVPLVDALVNATARGDLAAVPVLDAPPVTTVIAWPPHSRSLAVAGLVRAATRL